MAFDEWKARRVRPGAEAGLLDLRSASRSGRARTSPSPPPTARPSQRFYEAALAAGGTDNGPPGLREHYHSTYYSRLRARPRRQQRRGRLPPARVARTADSSDSLPVLRRLTGIVDTMRPMSPVDAAQIAPGAGRRILVVDDEPSIVDAVATALRYEGYEVDEASNGRDALGAVDAREPDLIVLDWMLPDLDGHRGRPAPARAGLQDRDPLPDREGLDREQGRGAARRRRRLRHEAVQPRRDRRAHPGDPPPLGRRAARRRAPLRRPRARRGRHEVFRGETPIALTATEFALLRFFMLNPRRVLTKGADPAERLALRLRRQRERRRDVRQLPAQEARRARAAADQDGAAGRLHARSRTGDEPALTAGTAGARGARSSRPSGCSSPTRATTRRCARRSFDRVDQTLDDDHRARCERLARAVPSSAASRPRARRRARRSRPGGRARASYVQVRSSDGTVALHVRRAAVPGEESPSPPKLPATIDVPAIDAERAGDERVVYFTVPATSGDGRYRVRASTSEPAATHADRRDVARATSTRRSAACCRIELFVTIARARGDRPARALDRDGSACGRSTAIGRTADEITAGDLSHRVERAEPRTEVGRLGLALNTMLDRIEASDRRLRRFVADASHELRTPLAAVSAYAELFGARRRQAPRRPRARDDAASRARATA